MSNDMDRARRRMRGIAEFGAEFGLSRSTTNRLLAAGQLQALKVGRRTLITEESIDNYIASLPAATFRAHSA